MTSAPRDHTSNPFCTRFVRPGAVEYLFPAGHDMSGLLARIDECGWRGAIVGPHGSGKSTLLAALVRELDARDVRAATFTLRDRQRHMPRGWRRDLPSSARTVVLIDGYEQLSRLSRLWVRLAARRHGWGLIVTAHGSCGLPLLLRTQPSIELALRLVERLLPTETAPTAAPWVDRPLVAESFARHGGDLRELLFDLYDLYEQRKAERREATLRAR